MRRGLGDVRREYDRLDALCGVDTSSVELRISTRASKRLGSCTCLGNSVARITISDFVMDAEDDSVFLDTIRHEYAHALVKLRRPREKHGHDALWKAACLEVGCAPARCCDPALVPAAGARRQEPYRYRLRCLRCGTFWNYKRRCRTVQLVAAGSRSCVCPRCGNRRFALEKPDA